MLIEELDDITSRLTLMSVPDAIVLSRAANALERFAAEFVQEEGEDYTTALMTDIGKTYPTREAALSRVIQWAETGE